MNMKRIGSAVAAALIATTIAAFAANTTFFTSIGDQVFPFTPPTTNPAAPGTIDNMTVGANTPEPGTFTTLDATTLGGTVPPNATVSQFHLDTGTKTATATAGAATLNKMSGTVTSESLTTAAGATYTLTVTDRGSAGHGDHGYADDHHHDAGGGVGRHRRAEYPRLRGAERHDQDRVLGSQELRAVI